MSQPHDLTAAPLALVTGASTGIGFALARQFLDHGYDVMVAADEAAIHKAASSLTTAGRQVIPVQVDLAQPEGVTELYATVTRTGRPLEAVALNAGIAAGGPFHENPLDDDLRVIDLNVRSTVHLAKLVVRDMVARGQGKVLVTASIAAKAPGPGHSTYAASKAFVHSFAEGIRVELKGTGVTVTSLMPGPTDTEFFNRSGMSDTRIANGPKDDPADVAKDGFEALMAGKDHVVGGARRNQVQAGLFAVTPDAAAAVATSKMTKRVAKS
jgi:short-subunit dehydrogenase